MGMSIVLSSGVNDEESLNVLTEAADMGINFWVTSDSYGPFTNERLIGRWFNETGRRDEIFLATKFGIRIVDGKFEHRVDSETPIEKTVEAMAHPKKEGKIRYLGLSECSARTLRRAHKVHRITAAEMEFSAFALEIESTETNFLKIARDLGVKIIAYSPLGRGFLTGKIKSREDFDRMDLPRKISPRFSEENFGHNLKLVEALASFVEEKGCSPGQLALAWVLAQGDDFIPIPGTKHVKYLKENADAVNVEFSKEDNERIKKTIESFGGSKGARYPGAFLSTCFADSPELGRD